MRALVSLVLVAQLGGCNFAVKHPAAASAIAGGTLGFSTCFFEVDKLGTCAVVGGAAAAFLGLVAGIAIWTMGGDEEDHVLYDPILPGDSDPVQAGSASDGSPDGTQVDEPPTNVNAPPVGPVVPKEKQTPIPRLPTTPPPEPPPVEPAPPAPPPVPTP